MTGTCRKEALPDPSGAVALILLDGVARTGSEDRTCGTLDSNRATRPQMRHDLTARSDTALPLSSQSEPQVGHPVTALAAPVDLEIAEWPEFAGFYPVVGSGRQQQLVVQV